MSGFNLQYVNGVGILTGPTGRQVGFPDYPSFKLVKRDLYGKLDGNDNVTNGEVDTFASGELEIIRSWKDKVAEPTFHFRVFQKDFGSRLAVVAAQGVWWEIPSIEYLWLLQERQIVSRVISMVATPEEWSFFRSLYFLNEQNDEAILKAL